MEFIEDENSSSRTEEHVVFLVEEISTQAGAHPSSSFVSLSSYAEYANDLIGDVHLMTSLLDFIRIFPYHLCFDDELVIRHCGLSVKKHCPFTVLGVTKLNELFAMVHPKVMMSFTNIRHFINGVFVLRLKTTQMGGGSSMSNEVLVKGQMIALTDKKHVLFLCAPYITSVRGLLQKGLFLADIPLHDVTRDLILLNQSRLSQVEMNRKLEETTASLKKMAEDLEGEKAKTETLLKELLPVSVAEALRQGKSVEAGEYKSATILFTDIVTFTVICSKCSPYQVVELLNDMYTRFDRLTVLCNVYKVETIGDAYMVVGGVPEQTERHAEYVCNMAIGMLWECRAVRSPVTDLPLKIRAGLHTGAVVAGVVGKKMPRYCLFGDTVNTASRMESHGIPGKIHLSESTYEAAKHMGGYTFEERGIVFIKGKGDMRTYFLQCNQRKSVWEIVQRSRGPDQSIDGYAELHALAEDSKPSKLDNMAKAVVTANGQANGHLSETPWHSFRRMFKLYQTRPDATQSVSCCVM